MNTLLLIALFATPNLDIGIADVNRLDTSVPELACYVLCDKGMCAGSCFPVKLEVNRCE